MERETERCGLNELAEILRQRCVDGWQLECASLMDDGQIECEFIRPAELTRAAS